MAILPGRRDLNSGSVQVIISGQSIKTINFSQTFSELFSFQSGCPWQSRDSLCSFACAGFSCSEPSYRLCSKLVVRRLLRLLPSNDLKTPGLFGSDYKDYENLSNLFSLKPQSGDGRGTWCQKEHLSGVTLPWSGAFPCRGMDGKMSQKKFGKSLQSL